MFGSIYKAILGAGVTIVGAGVVENALIRLLPEVTPSLIKKVGWSMVAIAGAIGGIYGGQAVVDSYKEIKEELNKPSES